MAEDAATVLPRVGFFAGRLRSVRCAVAGLKVLLRSQRNAWIHAVATALVIALALCLHLAPAEWCWLVIAIATVWIAEALNTALELLCDVACPAHNPVIGKAKDVAAGAVLLAALAAVSIGALILVPHLR